MILPQRVFFNGGLKMRPLKASIRGTESSDDGCLSTEQCLAGKTVPRGIPGFSGRQWESSTRQAKDLPSYPACFFSSSKAAISNPQVKAKETTHVININSVSLCL